MPRVNQLKEEIEEFEGFAVNICDTAGNNLHGNKFIDGNDYAIRTDDAVTVTTWENQFSRLYPGFVASPLKKDGSEANGHNQLKSIRE